MKIEIRMPNFIFIFFDSHIGPCFLLPVHVMKVRESLDRTITRRGQLLRENMADEELLQFSHGEGGNRSDRRLKRS